MIDVMQEVLENQASRIIKAQEDIINECLSELYKLPITEETYKRISCITHNEQPDIKWYYLDGHKFIAMIDDNIDLKMIKHSTSYHISFKFRTAYTNSKFLKKKIIE